MRALVRGVTAASIFSGSMTYSSLQSTKTGLAPAAAIAPAVAMNVLVMVMTSSPGPTPSALRLKKSASVPEFTPTAYLVPQILANFSSNRPTAFPRVKSPDLTSFSTSLRMGLGLANCLRRYENSTFMRVS